MAAIKYPTVYGVSYAISPPAHPVADDYQRKLAAYLDDPQAFLNAYRVFKHTNIANWDVPYGDETDMVNETLLCVASCTISMMQDLSKARDPLDKKAVLTRHMRLVDATFASCPRAALALAVAVDRCVATGAKPCDIARLVMMYIDRDSILSNGV